MTVTPMHSTSRQAKILSSDVTLPESINFGPEGVQCLYETSSALHYKQLEALEEDEDGGQVHPGLTALEGVKIA